MSKLFEISKQQAELFNRAYFLDETNDDDRRELEAIDRSLILLSREADSAADWLGSMIHDAQFAKLQAIDLRKRAQHKEKVATNRLKFIKGIALKFLLDMNIKESIGTHFKLIHSLTPGALILSSDFNINSIPDEFVTVIPEHKELNKKEVIEKLRAAIYNRGLKKLDPDTSIAKDDSLPGLMLVRNESLTIK